MLPCLSAALEDYSTDPRGDVGSWVREAAMAVLVQVMQLLAIQLPQQALKGAGEGGRAGRGCGGGGQGGGV